MEILAVRLKTFQMGIDVYRPRSMVDDHDRNRLENV